MCRVCMLARGGRHGAMQLHQVFVYGTLKRGFFNYDAVLAKQEDATFVEAGTTTEAYPMFVDYYKVPYLVHRPGEGHRIVGELFSVGDAGLRFSTSRSWSRRPPQTSTKKFLC